MSPSISDGGGPVLDEATFQKLLSAAYVLQEHNDRLRDGESPVENQRKSPPLDSDSSAASLAQIVDAQHQIHTSNLDLTGAMNLIVDRIRKITGAQGAAICLLNQDSVTYRAASGALGSQLGLAFRAEASLSSSTLLHDALLRCTDTANDYRVNPEIARRLGIRSVIAAPVFHEGKTAGALELAFAKAHAFQEHDVRTCQLMAGLVTEALARSAQEEWRKGVAAERASMLEVLDRIKPQLARLAHEAPHEAAPAGAGPTGIEEPSAHEKQCQQCGSELAPGEVFCGSCGASRSAAPRNDLQSKWATLWNLKKVSDQLAAVESAVAESVLKPLPSSSPAAQDGFGPPDGTPMAAIPDLSEPSIPAEAEAPPAPPVQEAVAADQHAREDALVAASQAADRRVWLKSIAVSPPAVQLKGFWQKHAHFIRKHPGDLALGAAAILFLITIVWAISSDGPITSADSGTTTTSAANTAAKPRKKPAPPAPKLAFFDQLLVDLGLAEAPPAPSYLGNPNVPVWVDVHTGLYYCPGTELYGKTQQGKVASQHDAQLDQFEPASRKVCD
jgi:hypothetical protein